MSDLDERLRAIERVAPPDLWHDATTRSPGAPPSDRRGRLAIAILALAVAGSALWLAVHALSSVSPKPPPASNPDGRIVFTDLDPRGGIALFVVDADGTNRIQLTGCVDSACQTAFLVGRGSFDQRPAWSSDGTTIAFSRIPLRLSPGPNGGTTFV